MHKIGLKLWSTNSNLVPPSVDLFQKGFFDYIELYVVPGSAINHLNSWKHIFIPIILHAPHSYSGLNLSLSDRENQNKEIISEVDNFRHTLTPEKIIFHPGIEGSITETIRQIGFFKKKFPELFNIAIVENKPKVGLGGEICVGASPKEIAQIIKSTKLGFCLDIGHAINYAAWAGLKYESVIENFLELGPSVFHLSDGDTASQTDLHLNFGSGNFNLYQIIRNIPNGVYITIETDKDISMILKDFQKDVMYLKNLLNSYG